MSDTASSQEPVPEKLKLLKSPLSNDLEQKDQLSTGFQQAIGDEGIRHLGYAKDSNPTLLRNSQATNLETFYDLFLAACISLFNKNQQVNASDALSNYIGFFSLIWSTWLLTSMYDVRFVTDSVFERCARGVHMGVLVGFITTSPSFKTSQQDGDIFQTFSLILMISRLCIAVQYAVIMWHTRKYKVTFLPLIMMIVINIVSGLIYLGISFRFHNGKNSRGFYAWYIVGAIEIVVTMGLSLYYKVLSFEGTHLLSRVSLLTLIIFGEGVAQASGKITDIVKVGGHKEWTKRTIAVVTSGVSVSYVIFMLYFDWMPTWEISEWRQLAWSLLHYPLHLTMTMFVEGVAQLILYWKCVENGTEWATALAIRITDFMKGQEGNVDILSNLADFLQVEREDFTRSWKVKYTDTDTVIDYALDNIRNLNLTAEDAQEVLAKQLSSLLVTLENVLYQRYEVDFIPDTVEYFNSTEMRDKYGDTLTYQELIDMEYDHISRVNGRFKIVFQYTFICGGLFLAFLTFLYAVGRRKKWSMWSVTGVFLNVILSLGIALLSLIGNTFDPSFTEALAIEEYMKDEVEKTPAYAAFANSPGVLPTLLGAYLLVLFVNHMMGDGPKFSFFQTWKARQQRPESPVQPHVQQVQLQANTKYDPGSHMNPQQPQYDPYMVQQPYQPSARPYSMLRTTDPEQYAQPGNQGHQVYPQQVYQQQQQQQYQQQQQQQYTTVYEYSGNEGPRYQQ